MATRTKKDEVSTPAQVHVSNISSIEYLYGPNYSAFYSNNVSFQVNLLEFVLMFGETLEASRESAIIERRARITMNPIQAKALMTLLTQNIHIYERLNGTIFMPDNLSMDTEAKKQS